MGSGHDTVNYDFEWMNGIYSGFAAPLGLDLNCGSGNDSVFIRFGSAYANVDVKATLGRGDDVFDAHVLGRVDDVARLSFNVRGDAGMDKVFAHYIGDMDGVLDLFLDGGRQNDEIRSYVTLPASADGVITSRILGGAGDDHLHHYVAGFGWYASKPVLSTAELSDLVYLPVEDWTISGLIDGGAGLDTAYRSGNVALKNCEVVV
jgi:hypothetical protein